MNKPNLFTLFIVVIVVVVIAEVLVNDYNEIPDLQGSLTTNVLGDTDNPEEGNIPEDDVDSMVIEFGANDFSDTDTNTDTANPVSFDLGTVGTVTESVQVDAQITFGLINLTGLQNVTLQRVPFNGILFERVDLRGFSSVEMVQQNLLQGNKFNVASFYEFHGDSTLLANEIYLLIKDKALTSIDASVNETNQFGDSSYYVNYGDRPNTAFLVVKTRESVYSLTYKKELHSFMESLLQYLSS